VQTKIDRVHSRFPRKRWRCIVRSAPATFNLRSMLRAFEEQILQHHSVVMRLVMRGEHQRDPTMLRKRT